MLICVSIPGEKVSGNGRNSPRDLLLCHHSTVTWAVKISLGGSLGARV